MTPTVKIIIGVAAGIAVGYGICRWKAKNAVGEKKSGFEGDLTWSNGPWQNATGQKTPPPPPQSGKDCYCNGGWGPECCKKASK